MEGTEWVHFAVSVVVALVPQLLDQSQADLTLGKGNLFTRPQVHLASKVKDEDLQQYIVSFIQRLDRYKIMLSIVTFKFYVTETYRVLGVRLIRVAKS